MFKSIERQVDLAFVDNISNENMIIFYLLFCFCLARSQNVSEVIDADHIFDSYHGNQQKLMFGEAALGGIGSTSVLIILMAILRILQIYKQRRQQQQQQQEQQQHKPQKQQPAEEQQAGKARPQDNTE